jgi:hypothetical protein
MGHRSFSERRSGRLKRCVFAALAVAAAFVPRVDRADEPSRDQPSEQSEGLIRHGVELRRAGRNGEALVEFEKAYALTPTARAQAQVALALQALGDWLGAESGLEEALRAADDPWIAQHREVLEGALATIREHLGLLYVQVNVAQGELVLNGVSHRSLPLSDPIRMPVGHLEMEVRAPGYEPVRRAIEVSSRAEVHETFVLQAVTASPQPPTKDVLPVARRGELAGETPSAPARSLRNVLAGSLALGAAGAFGAGGVVAWRVHQDNAAIYNDNSRCLVGTRTRGEQCGSYAQASNVALGFEVASFALAAGAAGLGAWLLWRPAPPPGRGAIAACGLAGPALGCMGRF